MILYEKSLQTRVAIMDIENYSIGSYCVTPPKVASMFEDESVGNSQATGGLVVSRIDGDQVFVREWHINAHFEGADALEQFERSRETQDFEFWFTDERILQESVLLDGHDPVLQRQLCLKLSALD